MLNLGRLSAVLVAGLVMIADCPAQQPGVAAQQPASPNVPAGGPSAVSQVGQPKLSDFPPSIRLGIRAASIQSKIPASDTVVIVSDEAAYVAAIAKWTPTLHFPVLIDDGSWHARETIARFVRAYQPARVVRWPSSSPTDGNTADTPDLPSAAGTKPAEPQPPAIPPLPGGSTERRAVIEAALASAWQTPNGKHFEEQLKAIGLTPMGIVVMNDRDPAWTAGLALAAGRGQPIVWAGVPDGGGPSGYTTPEAADALAVQITAACDALGYAWKDLGDELDAVTLCINAPVKIFLGQDDRQGRAMLALTDVIGRHKDARPTDGKIDYTARWAWCGEIFGSSPRAAADAMSALFLAPTSAWFFDGYPDSDPWNTYDATKSAEPLTNQGWKCVIDDKAVLDTGGQSLDDWRRRAAGGRGDPSTTRPMGVDAGFIAVNSKGEAGWFELTPGTGKAGDMPLLRRPSMVYFVHSWSATAPTKRETLAARLIEHGAYAYCGSVHEPYLQGFVPTPAVTVRLAGGLPWGAAVRFDNGPAWKIALFGDPLITVRPPRTKQAGALPLGDTTDLADQVAVLGKAGDYASMMRTLSMLGRDEDALRLARALLKDKPDAVASDVAAAGAMSAFLQGDTATLVALLDRCKNQQAETPMLADLAWQALYPVMKALNDAERRLLVASIRPDNAARDARELLTQVEQAGGTDGKKAREELITRARTIAIHDTDKNELDALLRE